MVAQASIYSLSMPDLQSFSLQAGLARFKVGEIQFQERRYDGSMLWSLRGQPGFQYLIERSAGDFVWRPFLTVSNAGGVLFFSDVPQSGGRQTFYRGRILD
jgi:hypothetical protein